MKALTILQPWATLVAIGAKKIETRSWATGYRGPLAIHAGRSLKFITLADQEPFKKHLWAGDRCDMPIGAIVATCDLIGVYKIVFFSDLDVSLPERLFGDFTIGRYVWMMENMKKLESPIPAKGAMGLWEWKEGNHDRT